MNRNFAFRNPAFTEFFRGLEASGVTVERAAASRAMGSLIGKRVFDISLALPLCVLALPLIVVLGLLVRVTSKGPAIHWSHRIGKDNRVFRMPKLRTMSVWAPQLATHLFSRPEDFLAPFGRFLRRTSLDELPQLFSILAGDLSFVGPRPALFNQDDLVALRTSIGIHRLMPGLTGWAQVNGRDSLTLAEKVRFDAEYLETQSFWFDLRILGLTLRKVLLREGIRH